MATQIRSLPQQARRVLVPLLLTMSLLLSSLAGIAYAVHDVDVFELEGDAVNDAGVTGDDWNQYFSGASPSFTPVEGQNPVAAFFGQDVIGNGDDALQTGGSKDTHDLTDWILDPDFSTPDKDDLDNAYALAYVDDGDVLAYFGTDRFDTNGDAKVGFWFLQGDLAFGADGHPTSPHIDGDLLVQSNFTKGGDISSITVYEWKLGWDKFSVGWKAGDEDNLVLIEEGAECDTNGIHEACAIVNKAIEDAPWPHTDKDDNTVTNKFPIGSFFEGGINLTSLLADSPTSCFSSFLATTRSSQEASAQLKDIVFGSFDICGGIDIVKEDTSGNALDGAGFAVYDIINGTALDLALGALGSDALTQTVIDGLGAALTPVGTCTSGGDCSFDSLAPGVDRYLVVELTPPPGYALSDPNYQIVSVERFVRTVVTFENPRIPYWIDVTPETDINPVGLDHDFLVTARVGDETTPVPDGTELSLDWQALGGDDFVGSITAVTDNNGTTTGLDTTSTTCETTTVSWNGGSVDGACIITVSSDATGSGTLVATLDLPYVGGSGSAQGTSQTDEGVANLSSIWDDGDKTWRGYDLTVDVDATNLLGDAHVFTVSVTETGPNADATPAGVILVASWSGPAGSTVVGDGTSIPGGTTGDAACTTNDDGECDFTVDSDTSVGTGTLTVTAIVGQIGNHPVTITSFPDATDTDMDKTWIEYRLWVTPQDDINQVGWDHTFTVHVQFDDGHGWTDVDGAMFSTDDWEFTGAIAGSLDIDASDCATGTDGAGECDIVATSDLIGSVTLTVDGVTVPFEGGTHLTLSDTALSVGDGGSNDNTGDKTWVDYGVTIGEDGVNLLGDEHPFTVTVTRDDGTGSAPLAGATVYLTWDGPSGSTISELGGSAYSDADAGTAGVQFTCVTDADGQCDFEVDSNSSEGLGTLSVTKVVDPSVTDGDLTASITFELGEKDTTKEWVSYDVDVDDDSINLTGDDHVFTITATRTDASGTSPADGATVSYTWTGAGSADPATSCVTDGSGECEVTVSSDSPGTGTLTVTGIQHDGFDVDLTAAGPGQSSTVEFPESASKTWVEVDVDISGDATNLVGEDHTFAVTATIDDGTGAVALDSDALAFTTSGAVGSVDSDATTCDDGGTDAAGACDIVVTSSQTGQLTVTLTSITFTYGGVQFVVDLTASGSGQSASLSIPVEATKTWIDYALAITPQQATNLLPTNPDHPMTVTLSSSDAEFAPVAGQTLNLSLTSDNGAQIVSVNGGDITPTTSTTCVTDGAGQCDLVISASTPGHATLSASYDIYIDEVYVTTISSGDFPSQIDGDDNGQDADKDWTTFLISVNGPAINLLGTPHDFTVTVRQTFDGVNFTYIEGAVFGTAPEDGSFITVTDPASITGGTCFTEGTDELGQCTVTVESPETTIATLTATYEGTVERQSAAFVDENTKQWVNYRLNVDPDTDDNLVNTNHVFTVTIEIDLGDGEGFQPLEGAVPAIELGGVGSLVSNGCEAGTAADGTCTVTITSGDAGLSTLTATYEGVATNGELTNEAETALFTDEPALKNWVDYRLVMSEDAVNPVGTTHTFTATLTVDTGDGFGPAAGETLDLSIAGVGSVTDIITGTVAGDARGGSCVTDAAGSCDIVITSNEVGQTTVTASYLAEVGDTSGTFEDEAVKTWVSNPAISLVKSADATEAELGQLVTYTYVITNTGDVVLNNVTLVDEIEVTGIFDALLDLLNASEGLSLQPGESVTFHSTRLVTEPDFPGPIDNVAETTGTSPDGQVVRDDDDWSVTVGGSPAISLVKSANITPDETGAKNIFLEGTDPAGETVTYTYVITNTGNVTLSNITLDDYILNELPTEASFEDITFAGATATYDGDKVTLTVDVDSLAPGDSTIVTATFPIRAIDVTNVFLTNVAETSGTAANGAVVKADDPEQVIIIPVLPLIIEKPPLPATGVDAGDLLLWAMLTGGLGLFLLKVLPQPGLVGRREDED